MLLWWLLESDFLRIDFFLPAVAPLLVVPHVGTTSAVLAEDGLIAEAVGGLRTGISNASFEDGLEPLLFPLPGKTNSNEIGT